jgi:hypothetical protein
MANDANLVELTTCADSSEAGALRSRLEAEGIPSIVQGEHHHAMLGTIYGGVIDVRVMVPEAALERARKLMAEWEAAEPASDGIDAGPGEPKEGEARCADHGAPSIGTCVRCGAFVCVACVGGADEELICPSCDARTNQGPETPRRQNTRAVATTLLVFLALPILLALLLGGFRMIAGR